MMLRHLPLLFAVALPAQTLTFAEGTPAALTIVTVPEANPAAADTVVLQGVELLPIEISGRTLSQAGDPTRARLLDRNGLLRVELPGGGRLLRYRRGGGQFWGFLQITASGAPRVVLELPGVGASLQDPFDVSLGVAADGRHAAVPLAGGGMWIVRLDGGVFASTGTPARLAAPTTMDIAATSVLVGPSVVWFQGPADTVWRCALADGGTPVDVSPPAQGNSQLKGDPVMAGDGSRIVFLYGPHNAWRLWTADLQNGASVLPPPPSKYEEPNYLPAGLGEPAMLLSDDGSRLFFVDSLTRDELWVLDVNGSLPALQITEDQIFQPYIGSHILPRFAANKLVVAIGDPAQMDWFAVDLAPAGGVVANLSGTGSVVQPFPSGAIDPRASAQLGNAMLLTEQTAAGLSMRVLDPITGANGVVAADLAAPPVVGDALVGAGNVLLPTTLGDQLFLGSTGSLLAAAPPGFTLAAPSAGPLYSATWVQLPIPYGVAAFFFPDGSLAFGPLEPGTTQVSLTPLGGTVLTGASVRYLAPGTLVVLNRPAVAVRWCLSGAGA